MFLLLPMCRWKEERDNNSSSAVASGSGSARSPHIAGFA